MLKSTKAVARLVQQRPRPTRLPIHPPTTRPSSSTACAPAPTAPTPNPVEKVPDFSTTQSTRPDFNPSTPINLTKSPNPTWRYGSGAPSPSPQPPHLEIDPYAPTRPVLHNYTLLISAITPRPIGFISTVSATGVKNLAPFSYFQLVDHDPPLFVAGFSARPGGREKDTFKNLKETGECVVNSVGEGMIEAVNATSLDAPPGVSEWELSGLTEAPATTVRAGRVRESVFSVEGKVVDVKVLGEHGGGGMSKAGVVLIQATRFWVREDAVDAEGRHVELEKLRPVGQLGGMAYARVTETFELPRRRWADEVGGSEVLGRLAEREAAGRGSTEK